MKPTEIFSFLSLIITIMFASFGLCAQNTKISVPHDSLINGERQVIVINDSLIFEPPITFTGLGSDFERYRFDASYKKPNEIQNISKSAISSKYLYIIDDKGNIVNGQLLEDNSNGKDTGIFRNLFNAKFIQEPAKLNGKPCYCYLIMTYKRYTEGTPAATAYIGSCGFEYRPIIGMTSQKE